MNAIAVLFGGGLRRYAFEALGNECAFAMTVRRAAMLEGVSRTVLFVLDDFDEGLLPADVKGLSLVKEAVWDSKTLLEALTRAAAGFDLVYFAWADTPLLDGKLAGAIARRFFDYAAEYGYADGWPAGLAPELLLPSTAGFLLKLNGEARVPVERDTLFAVLQKDINAFDIETEVSPVDLRAHRLNFAADSKRNLLLIRRFLDAGFTDYTRAEHYIENHPEFLRTLPAFFPVMVSGECPNQCAFCPWTPCGGFMAAEVFEQLLGTIAGFAGDAVIGLSLWGELSLHPKRLDLIGAVLARRELSLVIETCGIGWQEEDAPRIAEIAGNAAPRENGMAALSWIVSLDSADEGRYRKLHGANLADTEAFVRRLISLFPGNVYVQALRCQDSEDDIEMFYHRWQKAGAKVIIQKYDNFCGLIEDLRAGDISPLERAPCWHIMRDMPILLDGSVVPCREGAMRGPPLALGNAITEPLEALWERGAALYKEHCNHTFCGVCGNCDEYYTFNF